MLRLKARHAATVQLPSATSNFDFKSAPVGGARSLIFDRMRFPACAPEVEALQTAGAASSPRRPCSREPCDMEGRIR